MKKKITKEVVIAIIAIISLFVFYFGLNYLKGVNMFKPSNHYYVLMPSVTDLQNSSPIYVDGFKIGVVNSINFNYGDPSANHILVEISLDKKMRVQTGSYVELKSSLTAGAYLDLKPNKYVSTYCQVGDTISGVVNPSIMDKLTNEMLPQVEAILPRLDSILMGVQAIVTHPALNQSFDHIEATLANLEKTTKQLNLLVGNEVPDILTNLKKVSSDFTEISEGLKQVDLNNTLGKVDLALENIEQLTRQLNNKDSSLGLLLNDTSLYNQLDSTARNAAILLKDLKENPKKYVHFSVF